MNVILIMTILMYFSDIVSVFFYKHIFGLHTAHQVPRDAFHQRSSAFYSTAMQA